MAKKSKKLSNSQKAEPEYLNPDSDTRPEHSPYTSDTCALYFQRKGPLRVHHELLRKSPKLSQSVSSFGYPTLHLDVSLDAGHVLVHFLVTRDYECLKPQGESRAEKNASEFATALRAYAAAKYFQLPFLCELAEKEIQRLGDELSLTSIIDIMEEAGPASLQNLAAAMYLEARIRSFWKGMTRPAADRLLSELGTPNTISKLILKIVAEFNSSGFLQLEKVLEKESAPAQASEVEPQDGPPTVAFEAEPEDIPLAVAFEEEPRDEPAVAVGDEPRDEPTPVAEVEPQYESPAGDVVEDSNPLATSFSLGGIEGQFSAEQSSVFLKSDENITLPKEISGTKSPWIGDLDLAPPEISEYKKKGKKGKKVKKKGKATEISGFVEGPPAPLVEEPEPPSPGLAEKPIRDETQTSASSYLLLEGTTGDKVDDGPATLLSSDDAHHPEMQCARQPEHLTLNGGWKTCLNCRKLIQQFSQELMEA